MTHILVVDDETNLVELVRGYLQREGFTVASVADGPAAVEAARTECPDVVVLDLMLPGFDGLEVCRRLRQFSDAYVLMLTALRIRPMLIGGLVRAAAERLEVPFTDKGVTLVADVEPSPRSVLADSDRTLQVLTNLLGNALRYTDRGGTVHVRSGTTDGEVAMLLPILVLALSLSTLSRIFERFYRVDKSRSRALGAAASG